MKLKKEIQRLLAGILALLIAVQLTPSLSAYAAEITPAASLRTVTAEGCEGAGSKTVGTEVTVTAPAISGEKAFVKWEAEGLKEGTMDETSGVSFRNNPISFTMPNNDVTLKPVYKDRVEVSRVTQTEKGKGYLEVEGKPWFYHFIQNMGIWERLGNHDEFKEGADPGYDENYPQEHLPLSFTENMFEKTDNLNYNTISQVLWWREIEVEPGVYDFTSIDAYISWAKKYGMKIDLAWFGSVCGMGSRIPGYSQMTHRTTNEGGSQKADVGYQHTAPAWYANPDYYNAERAGAEQYSLNLKAENAGKMKQAEYLAVQALFNHLAETDPDHTVISVQIENEPNGSGGQFGEYINWMNYVAKAVKESAYVVATRVNYIGKGYPLNINDYEYLDFAGPDVYSTDVRTVQNAVTGGKEKSPLLYIPENSGGYKNITTVATAAFIAGGFYGTWSVNNWYCDSIWHGIYQGEGYFDEMYYNWELGRMPALTSQGVDMKHYNVGLNKMGSLITVASADEMTGLNIDTNTPEEQYDNFSHAGDYAVGLKTEDGAVGIVVQKDENLYVTTDTANIVMIMTKERPNKVTAGSADQTGAWTSTGEKTVIEKDGEYLVELKSEECIELQMPERAEPPIVERVINLALTAAASTSEAGSQKDIANVNDGNPDTLIVSKDKVTFPQDITLTWEEGQSFDTIELGGCYAKDQGLKSWTIQVSKDGQTWETVNESADVEWATSDGTIEMKRIQLPLQTDIRGLKINITDAYMTWNHYVVNEIRVFDKKCALRNYIEESEKEFPDGTNYPEDAWNNFKGFIDQAKALLAQDDPAQEEMDQIFDRLIAARQNLNVIKAKAELGQAVAKAKEEAAKESVYTKETLDVLNSAIASAEAAISNPAVLTKGTARALAALQKAIEGLVKTKALKDQIAQAEALDLTKYEEAGKADFAAALKAAKAGAANDKLTQEEADRLQAELQDAMKALKLKDDKPGVRPVRKVQVTGISKQIAAGKKIKLTAKVTPANATGLKVKWKSSNTKIATVTSKGIVTMKKNSGGKKVTITATAAGGGRTVKKTYKITSMKGAVKKVAISGQKSVKVGKTLKLKAKVTVTKKQKANKKLQWKSSNTKWASVSGSGKVTAKKAGKGKTVKITASATDGSGKKALIKVKIK